MAATNFNYLRLPSVLHETGLSRSQVYRLIQQGQFPAPVKLSERCAAWRSDLIQRWKLERAGIVDSRQSAAA